jgi:PBP1b-binding outer membrane lipoprotein LpoB
MIKSMIAILGTILLLFGCSANNKSNDTSKEDPKKEVSTQDSNKDSTNDVKQNKDLTKKISDEKGVVGGQVYEQDGTAVGTLVLDKKVTDKEAKELAEHYADEIKKEYKNLPVNVQAVRDGKNVASVQLENK